MSTNGNGWKPRRDLKLTCPSGQEVTVRRPGPEFILRNGRVARTFSSSLSATKQRPDQSAEDYHAQVLEEMPDNEMAALMVFARGLVCGMMVSPKLVLSPRADSDEIGPDDMPMVDFLFLFNYGMTNFLGIKVPVGESEVEVSDLETFRPESGIQGDSVDGVHVPIAEPEREAADQGLVGSAGT